MNSDYSLMNSDYAKLSPIRAYFFAYSIATF